MFLLILDIIGRLILCYITLTVAHTPLKSCFENTISVIIVNGEIKFEIHNFTILTENWISDGMTLCVPYTLCNYHHSPRNRFFGVPSPSRKGLTIAYNNNIHSEIDSGKIPAAYFKLCGSNCLLLPKCDCLGKLRYD